jgi:hypothetical protein
MEIQARNKEEIGRNRQKTRKKQARNRLSIEREMMPDKVKKSLALRLSEPRCEPRITLHEQ